MSENQCTWKAKDTDRCQATASHPQIGRDGRQWANLCADHEKRLNELITSGEPPKLVGAWIAASGGPAVLAGKM